MRPFIVIAILITCTSLTAAAQDIPFGPTSMETFHQIESINQRYDILQNVGGLAAGYGLVVTDPGIEGGVQAATTDADNYTTAADFIRSFDILRKSETRDAIDLMLIDSPDLTNEERQFWTDFRNSLDMSGHGSGSTGGDPHIATLDGYFYDLQTIGEFILCKSATRNFEIQVRQKAWSGNVSVNSAVAMNVHGTRVSFYASDFPDDQTSVPLRIDGKPYSMKKKFVKFKKGGAIQKVNDHYFFVWWETGEKAAINISEYMDIVVTVPRFKKTAVTGLMGNNNNNKEDDLKTGDGHAVKTKSWGREALKYINQGTDAQFGAAEKSFNESISKQFADSWRIDNNNTLFTYAPHKSTTSFSNSSFPNSYNSVSDLSPAQVAKAKKTCHDAGVTDEQLQGCVYDVAFTNQDVFAKTTAFLGKTKSTFQQVNTVVTQLDKKGHLKTEENKIKQKIKKGVFHL